MEKPTITVDLSGEQGNIFTLMSEARSYPTFGGSASKHGNRVKSKIETKLMRSSLQGR